MSHYKIRESLIPRAEVQYVAAQMRAQHECKAQRGIRWGFTLEHEGWLFDRLAGLEVLAAQRFGCPARLSPHWSSCQMVYPGERNTFPAHQDVAALGILKETDRGCVFWVPLEDITPDMPGLAVLEDDVGIMPHVDDGRGVSIIAAAQVNPQWCFRVLDTLKMGDVVEMDALCVHKTHLPAGCVRSRLSLDLRAKPV